MVLLLAQEHALNVWWFEFVDAWGNSASIIGLVFSVVAFPVTWNIQARIRRANQTLLRRIAAHVLAAAVEELHRDLTTSREAGRLGLWLRVYDCCQRARFGALRLVGNPQLTADEAAALRASADDLTQVIQYIEGNKLNDDPSANFQKDKKAMIERMADLLASIQARLGSRTWEV